MAEAVALRDHKVLRLFAELCCESHCTIESFQQGTLFRVFLVRVTHHLLHYGAIGETRTPTPCGTATSTLRVYQFRHDRIKQLNLVGVARFELARPFRGVGT